MEYGAVDYMSVAAIEDEAEALRTTELELKKQLMNTLKSSGVLGSVKAQFRQEFINSLKGEPSESSRPSAIQNMDVRERMTYSMLFYFLKNRGMLNTLSVFSAESGVQPNTTLITEKDISQTLKFYKLSNYFNTEDSQKWLNKLKM